MNGIVELHFVPTKEQIVVVTRSTGALGDDVLSVLESEL